jgi:hypothetical protein
MSGREQIEHWIRSVFAREDVSDDLLANGHALAAAYRLGRSPGCSLRASSRDIIAAIEEATDDDDAVAVGFALSCETPPDDLDSLTNCDSRLRRGYILLRSVSQYRAVDIKWRATADAQLQNAVTQYHKNRANESLLAAVSGDVLGCIRCHYTSAFVYMALNALDLMAVDQLHPEFALLFVLTGLKMINGIQLEHLIDISATATKIAAAFERWPERKHRPQPLVLPPVIV